MIQILFQCTIPINNQNIAKSLYFSNFFSQNLWIVFFDLLFSFLKLAVLIVARSGEYLFFVLGSIKASQKSVPKTINSQIRSVHKSWPSQPKQNLVFQTKPSAETDFSIMSNPIPLLLSPPSNYDLFFIHKHLLYTKGLYYMLCHYQTRMLNM